MMNFYEVINPCYALIKTENLKQAKNLYSKFVSQIVEDTKFNEVSEDYVFQLYFLTKFQDEQDLSISQILEEIKAPNSSIWMIGTGTGGV